MQIMLETILDFFCSLAGALPFECMKLRFMQEALLGVLLTAPLAAAAGIQVVNFRMSFFSDAIGHSAFAGVAFGLLFALSPHVWDALNRDAKEALFIWDANGRKYLPF